MTNTNQMLRRIDDEITFNRQEIAKRQVDIARLEDTRRVLMGLEEADQAAAEIRKGNGGLLAGSHSKPLLIVRKVNGHDHAEGTPEAPQGKRKARKDKGLKRARGDSDLGKMRARILEFLKPGDEPIASADLAANLGLPVGEEHRKPMQNALYHMRVKGTLKRDDQQRYYRPLEPQPSA